MRLLQNGLRTPDELLDRIRRDYFPTKTGIGTANGNGVF